MNNNTNRRYRHLILWFVLLLACVQLAFQIGLLFKGVEFIQLALIHDDTYYYLQPAWNVKELGFVTFDGLHKTNGVQMLWFWVVVGLAFLSPTKIVLLYLALGTAFALNAASYVAIWKIGKLLKYPVASVVLACLWFLEVVSAPRVYTMGVENSLHALVFWCVVWQIFRFLLAVQNQERLDWFGFTLVLILNAWSRLDSAIFSVILYIVCIGILGYKTRDVKSFFTKHGKPLCLSALSAASGAGLLFGLYWLMGNSFVPVSGLIKSGSGIHLTLTTLYRGRLLNVLHFSIPYVFSVLFPEGLIPRVGFYVATAIAFGLLLVLFFVSRPHRHSTKLLLFQQLWNSMMVLFFFLSIISQSGQYNPLAAYAGFILSVILLSSYIPRTSEFSALQTAWLALFAAFGMYHIIIVVGRITYESSYTWYRSPLYIFWMLTALFIVYSFDRMSSQRTYKNILQGGAIGSCILYVVLSSYYHASLGLPKKNLFRIRYHAAEWLAENIHSEAVLASWNAGQLGYFANHALINLDGLVNSVDYYRNVKRGSTSLLEYLYESNVSYLVDYCCVEELLPYLQPVHSFPPHSIEWWEEPVYIERIQVWRLLPQN